jgi:F0F1-type ATP synthase assembly protein I
MIQSLFNHDDEAPQPPENQSDVETEESIKRQLDELSLSAETPEAASEPVIFPEMETQTGQTETGIIADNEDDEIETIALPRIEQVYANASEPPVDNPFSETRFAENAAEMPAPEAESIAAEIEPLPQASTATQYRNVLETENAPANERVSQTQSIFQTENVSQTEARPLTTAETLRQSGMAWSAAIGLFGSVLFMLILGWFFDLLTGASPIGLVVGIIIGASLGFYQFFRITSQIFKKD